jgi:hypothetical protein
MGTNTRLPDLMLRSGVGCLFELGGRRFWSRPASAGYGMASPSPVLRLAYGLRPPRAAGLTGEAPPAPLSRKRCWFFWCLALGQSFLAEQLSGL